MSDCSMILGPPRYELLVGSDRFWRRARGDIEGATRRVLVQALTFEGDRVGLAVASSLTCSRASDRRVLVDDFTRMVISDRFVRSPRYVFDRALRAEVRATNNMFRALGEASIGVRRTNPLRGNPLRYGLRNHKKLIVADDVAYIGGMNFSDHNFAWHDMMLRIHDADVASFLASDFEATWEGRAHLKRHMFGDLELSCLDGRTNDVGFQPMLQAIAEARQGISVVSPYLSFPFIEHLGRAARRGVHVEVLTPLPNNKPLVKNYLLSACEAVGVAVQLTSEMTHLKAMLIDEQVLALGSSNFDFPSYYSMEEYLALVRSPSLIAAFQAEVLAPLRETAVSATGFRPALFQVLASRVLMRMAGFGVERLGRSRRGATVSHW
jgi:cardiolipin synthase